MVLASAKISHVGMIITDIDKSRDFYGRILGLKELPRPEFPMKGIWYQLNGLQLHLMVSESFSGPHVHPDYKSVQAHLALTMTASDFSNTITELTRQGVKFLDNPLLASQKVRQAFIYDHDNNLIEINDEISCKL